MIGIGYLTFPKLSQTTGLLTTLLIILLGGLVGLFSTFLLIRSYHNNSEVDSYPALVLKILGLKQYYIITFCLISYITFSTTFFIYSTSLIIETIYSKLISEQPFNFITKTILRASIAFFGWFINLFRLQDIRWLGYISNFFSLSLGIILVVQMPERYRQLKHFSNIELVKININAFSTFGNSLFAFVNQFSVITIIKILKNSSASMKYQVRLISAFQITIHRFFIVCCYLFCGFFFSWRKSTKFNRSQISFTRHK